MKESIISKRVKRRRVIRPLPALLVLALFFLSAVAIFSQPLPAWAVCVGGAPNGILETGEDCDEGEETISCDSDCTIAECGDGTVNKTAFEECDDTNIYADDGCLNDCTQGLPGTTLNCIDDVTGKDNNCTANDVLLSFVLNDEELVCEEGSNVTLNLTALLQANSFERYDLGVFVKLDGIASLWDGKGNVPNDWKSGECWKDWLPPRYNGDIFGPVSDGTCSLTGETCNNPLIWNAGTNSAGCPPTGTCNDVAETPCNRNIECPIVSSASSCLISGLACESDADCFNNDANNDGDYTDPEDTYGDPCVGLCSGGQFCVSIN